MVRADRVSETTDPGDTVARLTLPDDGTAPLRWATLSFSSTQIRSAVFLPMPGRVVSRLMSPSTIAWQSSLTGMPDSIASASFGPMPVTVLQHEKQLLFLFLEKAEQGHGVFPDIGVDMEKDLLALVRQPGERVGRDEDLVADADDIDDHPVARFSQNFAGQCSNHMYLYPELVGMANGDRQGIGGIGARRGGQGQAEP